MSRHPILFQNRRFSDDRGWFSEVYSEGRFRAAGLDVDFVQDNHSFSVHTGTIRGLHFQKPPHAQGKLVRCTRGSILDYAVDIRHGSPTFAKYVQAELSADNCRQLYVPVGFAHAFVTLEPDVEVTYKVTDVYAPQCDAGLIWNDPAIAITWTLPDSGPVLSAKDAVLPGLAGFDSPFEYDGEPLGPLSVVEV
jgi:dTDP-4-dehydrorhamnose 3,5-epimerase